MLELPEVVRVMLTVSVLSEGPKKEVTVKFHPDELEVQVGGPPVTPAAVPVEIVDAGTGTTVPGTVRVISERLDSVKVLLLEAETVTGWKLVLVMVETSSDEIVSVMTPVVVTVKVSVAGD